MHDLVYVADKVFIYPHDEDPEKVQPLAGVIVTDTQTVLVDSGNSPDNAQAIKKALERIGAPPVKYIIYTHGHWDHTFGSCAFESPVIIAHDCCRKNLMVEALKPWSKEFIEEDIIKRPLIEQSHRAKCLAIKDWRGFRIVVPQVTFTQKMFLYLDGITLELAYVGGHHTDDSIIVRVVESKVLFMGDCYWPPSFHLRAPDAKPSWELLNSLIDDSVDIYIESHSSPMKTDEVIEVINLLKKEYGYV